MNVQRNLIGKLELEFGVLLNVQKKWD